MAVDRQPKKSVPQVFYVGDDISFRTALKGFHTANFSPQHADTNVPAIKRYNARIFEPIDFADSANWITSSRQHPTVFLFEQGVWNDSDGRECLDELKRSPRPQPIFAIFLATISPNWKPNLPDDIYEVLVFPDPGEVFAAVDKAIITLMSSKLVKEAPSEPLNVVSGNANVVVSNSSHAQFHIANSDLTGIARKQSAALISSGLTSMLQRYGEVIEESNSLHPNQKVRVMTAIDECRSLVSETAEFLMLERSNDKVQQASYFERFSERLNQVITEMYDPDVLATATPPVGLILILSGLGGLIGGPVGFGAGGVVGQLISGQIKAGSAGKELASVLKPALRPTTEHPNQTD